MTIRNTYVAEAWDKVYDAFEQINFTAYDYDTVKESLLQYLKIYHAENFNDFIESGDLVAVLEIFAMVAEMLAYRIDMVSHENFITTAQRKQSILRLARLISYRASRNIPARGLVKINTIQTSEQVFDSLGNDLTNVQITWNDPNNTNWKEQFFLVMNKVMTTKYGQPQKAFQIGDVLMHLYTMNNGEDAFKNGVQAFSAGGAGDQFPMEVVPVDLDENGPFERAPDLNSQMSILFASDGKGDGSDYTGFLMFVKQGTLLRTDYTILEPIENRRIELDAININDTDVWVYRVDDDNQIIENWKRVETLNEQNISFNNDLDTRQKFEIETLEGDRVAVLFGDGDFSDAPVGNFQIWTRVSVNQNINIPKSQIVDQRLSFNYANSANVIQSFSLTFSLVSAMQNNSASEQIEHIRQAAPATYYAQNRMVNGQDYNTYMLKDPSILKLKTVNRTFAGQPKYIEWNDASRKYENIKLFGDDLRMYYDISVSDVTSTQSARTLIDTYLEPLLQETGTFNILNYISATHPDGYGIISFPRRTFIEDNRAKNSANAERYVDGTTGDTVTPYGDLVAESSPTVDGSLKERTAIQGALDRHFYGEPTGFVTIGGIRHGIIVDPTTTTSTNDGKLYDESLKRTIDSVNTWPPGDTGSGLQSIANEPYFGIRYNRFLKAFGSQNISLISTAPEGDEGYKDRIEVFTIEVQEDKSTLSVISNIRGVFENGRIGVQYSDLNDSAPIDFLVDLADESIGEIPFEQGDAFIVEVSWSGLANKLVDPDWLKPNSQYPAAVMAGGYKWTNSLRTFSGATKINLNGWFELISHDAVAVDPSSVNSWSEQRFSFDPTDLANSWIFLIVREDDSFGEPQSYRILHREMKLVVESPTTKFWYNQNAQIIDSETKKPVYDKIRVLRSNLDSSNRPLNKNHIYDVVGFVFDNDGVVETTKLEVLPTDSISFTKSGAGVIDNLLQFEHFSADAYQFGILDGGEVTWLSCGEYLYINGYDTSPYDTRAYDTGRLIVVSGVYDTLDFDFVSGSFFSVDGENTDGLTLVRRRYVPMITMPDSVPTSKCNPTKGLDFMWQHFSPVTHLIDPSVTNIHDAFILSRGYYDAMTDFIRGFTDIEPVPPTPLELRTSYASLLKNKMLSDTLVLHPGKIKLLFGQLAQPQLRAKFRVVKSPSASFSSERIKTEIITVINTFFGITNWDFGDQFYATELISLIHQRLATQISSVVIVPMYSVNSFGSLFTIDSGFDEILQSCATVNDVEIVDALTPTVLRQLK
jgi:hypothetical protein